jgi:hypothetical protein
VVGDLAGDHRARRTARVQVYLLLLPQGLLPRDLAISKGMRRPGAAQELPGRVTPASHPPERAPLFLLPGPHFELHLDLDAIEAFHFANGWGMGLGTVVLVLNATFLWCYSLSCHSCRHIVGGRLKHFSRHPVRFKLWGFVSKLNARHMQIAWVSLVWVALTDLYVRLVASGWVHDPRFF